MNNHFLDDFFDVIFVGLLLFLRPWKTCEKREES